MRGRVNIIDLMDMPFNKLHEFYRYTFMIREEREKERIAEEKSREEKEAKEKERENNRNQKMKPVQFDKRLSPAAQARENKHNKSQADEKDKSEDNITTELPTPPRFDMEDLTDLLEEGI